MDLESTVVYPIGTEAMDVTAAYVGNANQRLGA